MEANKGINLEKSVSEKEVHDGNNADSGMSIDFFYVLFFFFFFPREILT
jgi:hypothetical protein